MMPRPLALRRLAALLCLILPLLAAPGWAQQAPSPPPKPAAASAEELERLVGTLQDESKRKALIDQLQALIAASRGAEPEAPPKPDGVLEALAQEIDDIAGEILTAAGVVVDAPRIVGWLQAQFEDERARARWLETSYKLGITFLIAIAAAWLARLLLRRPGRALAVRAGDRIAVRLFLLLVGAVIEVFPAVVLVGVAYIVLPLTEPRFSTRQVAAVAIDAILWTGIALGAARAVLLSPAAIALYPMSEETRNYLYIWVRRFAQWGIYGYAAAAAGWWLGVPGGIYGLVLRGTVLMLTILAVIFVLQNRAAVAEWLRGKPDADLPARLRLHVVRARIADIWHVLAIMYVVGTFGVFVLHVDGGFLFVARATVLSIVVLVAATLVGRFIQRTSQRGFAIGAELKARFPTLEARANRYIPALTLVLTAVVYIFAGLAILQAWGVGAFGWFESPVGRKVTASGITIAVVLLLALVIWELFSSAIERYLTGQANGRPLTRSARARTLLPLLRTTGLVLIIIMVALIVLSEIGVNIAPLLAGAGVVGLAIGFGSQALVKDVITGFFILVEDTLAVGDVVDIGGGHSGVVEAISIRAIKLRDTAGVLHTVPFGNVATVRNMTRDYAYVVTDANVLYREDPDRVMALLREIGDGLRQDPDWAPAILAPIEVFGLDRFTDNAVVVRARLKVVPTRQWALGREFNRRLKKAFDEAGIEMPAGNQTRYLEPKPPPEPAPAA